ncbi:MAG: hypothetical protein ACI91F_003474 [Candidatus Binatia bacterium]|jgi:hypothetical protein
MRFARIFIAVSIGLVALIAAAWSSAALAIDAPTPYGNWLAAAFAMAVVVSAIRLRPFSRAIGASIVMSFAVAAWWSSLEPSNERNWLTDVSKTTSVSVDGDRVTVRNLRNFTYRGEDDYTPKWEQREYDLSRIVGTDLFLSYWGPRAIAHTILSWEFDDGEHLAVSIETRKEVGESYSALLGFFRQFELYYVVADERDLVGLRTNHRQEDVYLYRLGASPDVARSVFRVAQLHRRDQLTQPERGMVQRGNHELYNSDRGTLATLVARSPFRLANTREWLHRRDGLRAQVYQHDIPFRGITRAKRYQRTRYLGRRPNGFLSANSRRAARTPTPTYSAIVPSN